MSANTSSAVMQQRSEARDSLDDFPTPPWATRAVCAQLADLGIEIGRIWEPCCNRGYMARPLGEVADSVFATDVHDYGWEGQDGVVDFLIDWAGDAPDVDFVFANPPFRLANEFIRQALRHARVGVAVFVRTAFVEGMERYATLFRDTPEAYFMPFVERVVIWKGEMLDPDVPVWNEKRQKFERPASATSYCWLIFLKGHTGPGRVVRIPPCRKAMTRAGDYPPVPAHLLPPRGELI